MKNFLELLSSMLTPDSAVMAVWMNSSAFGYVPVYILLGLIGFGTARMLRKWIKGR